MLAKPICNPRAGIRAQSLRPMTMPTMLATINAMPQAILNSAQASYKAKKNLTKKTELPERIFRKIKQKTRVLEISNIKKYTYTYTTPISESHAVFSKPGQYEKRNITYKK